MSMRFALVLAVLVVLSACIVQTPEGKILNIKFVSETEYIAGDTGQVIIDVRDDQMNVVQVPCTASIWYPNKTVFIANQLMTQNAIGVNQSGSQYVTFAVPSIEGTYEYQATCSYSSENYTYAKSFHVSSATRTILDALSKVQFISEGVDETRTDKWNVNSWRLEGNGTITGASCTIKEAPLFASQTLPPSGVTLPEACGVYSGAMSTTYNSYASNILGLYNLSQCWKGSPRNCATPGGVGDTGESEIYTVPSGGQALLLFYNRSTTNKGIRQYADMGAMDASQFSLLDCGYTQTVQPAWVEATGDPANVNNSVGNAFCIVLDEGFKAKTRTTYRQDCVSIGCMILYDASVWIGCDGGTFIQNSDKWFGFHWYSNHTYFASGNNYEINCDAQYSLNNITYTYAGLRQYVYVNNEGRIRAVTTK